MDKKSGCMWFVAIVLGTTLWYSTDASDDSKVKEDIDKVVIKVGQFFDPKVSKGVATVEVQKPSWDYQEKVQPIVEILKKGPNPSVDGVDLANLYLAYAKGLDVKLNGNYVIKRVEDVELSNRIAGMIQTNDIKGKYEGLPEKVNEVTLGSIKHDDKVKAGDLSESQRENLVEAFKSVAWACVEGAK